MTSLKRQLHLLLNLRQMMANIQCKKIEANAFYNEPKLILSNKLTVTRCFYTSVDDVYCKYIK